jgi:hypothetical protein
MMVPRVRTPVYVSELPAALEDAHHRLRGFGLSVDAYALAVAQLELEHGTEGGGFARALRGCFCFNFGNHDATAAERNDPAVTLFQTVAEHEDAPSGPYTAVHTRRAYPDAASGLVGYWTALMDGFPGAYDAITTGDAVAFAHALKAARYYTGDEGAYARDLVALQRAAPTDESVHDTDPAPAPGT